MLNLDKLYEGIVIGKTKENIFISTTILKPVKYTQPIKELPTGLKDIDIGDVVEFNLRGDSIPTKILICNLKITRKAEYKEYLELLEEAIDKLPSTIQYPKSKVISMTLQFAKEIDPLNWIRGFEETFQLTPTNVSHIELNGGQKVYEPLICFEKVIPKSE